jgi:predicted translin family RNA/ssDNA-binding protein
MNKKYEKLQARITQLEQELITALQKKSSSQAEINLPARQRQIAELKQQLAQLK